MTFLNEESNQSYDLRSGWSSLLNVIQSYRSYLSDEAWVRIFGKRGVLDFFFLFVVGLFAVAAVQFHSYNLWEQYNYFPSEILYRISIFFQPFYLFALYMGIKLSRYYQECHNRLINENKPLSFETIFLLIVVVLALEEIVFEVLWVASLYLIYENQVYYEPLPIFFPLTEANAFGDRLAIGTIIVGEFLRRIVMLLGIIFWGMTGVFYISLGLNKVSFVIRYFLFVLLSSIIIFTLSELPLFPIRYTNSDLSNEGMMFMKWSLDVIPFLIIYITLIPRIAIYLSLIWHRRTVASK